MIERNRDKIDVEVAEERVRQNEKWGEQNHPNFSDESTCEDYRFLSNLYREGCEDAFREGTGSWSLIFLEEVYEALAETDPKKLRGELIQVMAVTKQWIECIDRRTK